MCIVSGLVCVYAILSWNFDLCCHVSSFNINYALICEVIVLGHVSFRWNCNGRRATAKLN